MNNIYTDQSIEEGQKILSLWEKITSKPLTSREVEFYRLAFEAGRSAGINESIDACYQAGPKEYPNKLIADGYVEAIRAKSKK